MSISARFEPERPVRRRLREGALPTRSLDTPNEAVGQPHDKMRNRVRFMHIHPPAGKDSGRQIILCLRRPKRRQPADGSPRLSRVPLPKSLTLGIHHFCHLRVGTKDVRRKHDFDDLWKLEEGQVCQRLLRTHSHAHPATRCEHGTHSSEMPPGSNAGRADVRGGTFLFTVAADRQTQPYLHGTVAETDHDHRAPPRCHHPLSDDHSGTR